MKELNTHSYYSRAGILCTFFISGFDLYRHCDIGPFGPLFSHEDEHWCDSFNNKSISEHGKIHDIFCAIKQAEKGGRSISWA